MRSLGLAAVALFILCGRGFAEPTHHRYGGAADPFEPSIVAGYRALFTCSAHFIARRALNDIVATELVDVSTLGYPDPVIHADARYVSATDVTGANHRVAVYRDTTGCTLLPPGWSAEDRTKVPDASLPARSDVRDALFPRGDGVELESTGLARGYGGLASVITRAFDGHTYGDQPGVVTAAVLVLKGDRIIAERYRPGFGVRSGYRTWSTAKSITAALMAIASRKGIVDLDAQADIPEWRSQNDARQAITYKHLLWMSSGLESAGSNTNAIYFGGQDVISAATGTRLEARPGTRWKYANNDTLLLMRALRHRLNDDERYLRFPYEVLLHPLGMHDTYMEIDHQGNFVGSSQVYTTARDLARFGLFLARDGVWKGRRLLPEGWLKFATTPAPTKPPVQGQWGYGAQFWLFDQMPGIPAGTFSTAGNKGQFVTIVPSHDLIIVRTGVDPEGKRWQAHRFVADILQALQ